jgi:hypothetical protein
MARSSIGLALALGALLALAAEGKGADASQAAAEALPQWEYYQDLAPAGAAGGLVDFLLTPSVFDKARPDLGDLRLVDGSGVMVPYALRIRHTRDEKVPLAAREFNRSVRPDRSVEMSLDLGEAPSEHNEIDVTTSGRDFRRRLLLEGSNDDKNWSVLLDKVYLVSFDTQPRPVDVHRLAYPASRFRYLRVQVFPDRGLERDAPEITAVGIFRAIQVPGENVTLPANLGPREGVSAPGGWGSAWVITFGGDRVPVERLSLDVYDDEFTRPYQLEVIDEEDSRRVIAQGEWRRRRGEAIKPLEIAFPETTARKMRLVVTDYRNPSLNLSGVRYTAAAREVIFAPVPGPLKLYFGNPTAQAPHYDFAEGLPEKLASVPVRTSLGALTKNPEYRPPPKPWTERWPWLVYVVLGAASLVLLGILGVLGREAVNRHDRRAAT